MYQMTFNLKLQKQTFEMEQAMEFLARTPHLKDS
jgi:hypothetical protein